MDQTARLMDEHAAMDSVAADLFSCMSCTDVDIEAAARLKSQLAAMLDEHLSAEDPGIYSDIAAEDSRNLTTELNGLCADWQDYLERWRSTPDVARVSAFAAETRAMMDRVRERIALEQSCLATLS